MAGFMHAVLSVCVTYKCVHSQRIQIITQAFHENIHIQTVSSILAFIVYKNTSKLVKKYVF